MNDQERRKDKPRGRRVKRFYVNTALSAELLPQVREQFKVLHVDNYYAAEARFGLVAVTAAGGTLFEELSQAETVRRVLMRAMPDLFDQAAVAAVEVEEPAQPATDFTPTPTQPLRPLKPLKPNKTVLCVEDDPLFLTLLKRILGVLEIELVLVGNALEALPMIEDIEPDLVLLDLMMPGMNGWEVVHQMKANEVLKDIPVIIITALATDQDRVFAIEVAGVKAFLEKPVMPGHLRRLVWETLNEPS